MRDGEWTLIAGKTGYSTGGFQAWEAKRNYPADDEGPVELYHMTSDTVERINVAGEYPEKVKSMTEKLEQIRRQGRSAPRFTKHGSDNSGDTGNQ